MFKALVSGFVHFLDFIVLGFDLVGLSFELGDHLIFPVKALDLIVLLLSQDAILFVNEH